MASHVQNVAIIGAGGNIGSVIAEALIKQGKHKVTAITRPNSTSKLPEGLQDVKKVDQSSHSELVGAFKGQDVLVITLSVTAEHGQATKFVDAAIEAGVPYVVPNEYGGNYADEEFGRDIGLAGPILAMRKYIEEKGAGKTCWVAISCGFWYEYSLSGADFRYGFDFKEKTLTLYDGGKQHITTSTWPQVGRAVAKLLSLPVSGASPSLNDWKNKAVYVSSFRVNQLEMFQSVLRATGTQESEWKISHEGTKERFDRGGELLKQGKLQGFGMRLYVRSFYPDGRADLSEILDNEKLGLPQEDLDEATKVAADYALSGKAKAWTFE